jgi:hypothetical protein
MRAAGFYASPRDPHLREHDPDLAAEQQRACACAASRDLRDHYGVKRASIREMDFRGRQMSSRRHFSTPIEERITPTLG